MKRSTHRILTSHVGSLVRTPEIIEGLKAATTHRQYDKTALEANIRLGVKEIVDLQVKAGVDVPSDGEYSKAGFADYTTERLNGFTTRPVKEFVSKLNRSWPDLWRDFPGFMAQYDKLYPFMWLPPSVSRDGWEDVDPHELLLTAPITYNDEAVRKDIANFRAALDGLNFEEAFLPCITPPATRPDIAGIQDIYPKEDDYLRAMADAMHEEYRAVVESGFIVQLDLGLPARTNSSVAARQASEKQVEMINYALRDIPEDRVRYHLCWGSMNTPHHYDIPLREIIDIILAVNAQAYSLEAANARHEHEWMVWKDVKLPDGKILIPGIVSHQTNVVEHPELVAWRIKNFASVVGKENVIAGTDCGFSQNFNWIRVHPEVQWAKLKALAEGAALASKELWHN